MSGTAEAPLEARIAARGKVPAERVRNVFATYGLPLVSTPARLRPLRIRRLRVAGVRTGEIDPGPFDSELMFDNGVTALVASNFRGKTSVLELVTWCLRGTPRELGVGVRAWLTALDLDVEVAGQPLGFRLDLSQGSIASAVVLSAPDVDRLAGRRTADGPAEVTTLLRAANDASFGEQVQALMMDRLDLHPLVNSVNGTGTQTHGWPSYYAAIYLQAGGDRTLLGDQSFGGLAGRLLQVFLDLPATSVLTRVKTARDIRMAEDETRTAAARAAVTARADERAAVDNALATARAHLSSLDPMPMGPSLTELAAEARARAGQVADAQEGWNEAEALHRAARRTRQQDAKDLNDVTESLTARLLFHGLNPQVCPRCDQDIADERREQERTAHACAVCARPVQGADADREDVIAEARARLEGSTAIEAKALAALEAVERDLSDKTAALQDCQERLRQAQSASDLLERLAAQEAVTRLEGALSVLPSLPDVVADPAEAEAIAVLKAAAAVLDDDSKTAADEVFQELNTEIALLGRQFGIDSLERVEINRAGQLKVFKDGGAQDWFKNQPAGGRLRLRIAVVIALLRVGARHQISTHPGLLLIDSPKAEEVQDLNAHTLVSELSELARAEGLQIIITTTDAVLAHDVLPSERIIQAADGAPLW